MNKNDDMHRYDHMLTMPHHRSKKYKHMSMPERAAQFGAFRALTGYEAAISETGRLTDKKIELDEYEKSELDFKLMYICGHISDEPEVTITYFVPDEKKSGGEYLEHIGRIKKILYYEKKLVFCDGREVYIDNIRKITGKLFEETEF